MPRWPDITPEERFWLKVEKTDTCWLWTGGTVHHRGNSSGIFTIHNGERRVNVLAHRLAYEWLVGQVPEGHALSHTCRSRRCVNPAHLELITTSPKSKPLRYRLMESSKWMPNGCLEWQICLGQYGYGQIWHDGAMRAAHRVAYETFQGPIAEGKHLHHECKNPRCINPDHMRPVTPAEHRALHPKRKKVAA